MAHFHSFWHIFKNFGALSYEIIDAIGEISYLPKPGDSGVLKTHAIQRKSIDHEVKGKQNSNKNTPKIRPPSIGYFTYGILTGLKSGDNKKLSVDHVLCSKLRGIKNHRELPTQESIQQNKNPPLHLKHLDSL